MTPPLDLDAIQARCDAARPRPWALHDALNGDGFPGRLWVVENPADGPGDHHVMINIGTRDDAEFIARARDDVPALLTRVRELEAAVSAVRALDPGETYDERRERYELLDPENYHHAVGHDGAIGTVMRTIAAALNPQPAPGGPQAPA